MTGARPTIAIVGGGFSGAAVAYHLARGGAPADVLVFEPRARLGGGLAYGGDDPVHRVNVPAARMSLRPDDPDHFTRWLDAAGVVARDLGARAGAEVYPRRREFGRYVAASLAPYVSAGDIRHLQDTVVSLRRHSDGWRLQTSGRRAFRADIVVIATTHPAPTLPPQLGALRSDPRLITDALADNAVAGIAADERVLIIGAGLTAADLVAALEAQSHRGPITLISRRGLRARGRSPGPVALEGDFVTVPSVKATALLRRIRAAIRNAKSGGHSWESVIESVRNQGQDIWRALDVDARRRVVRHLRPFWDAHRFRAAPQIEAILDAKLKDGSLELRRARLVAVTPSEASVAVELRDVRRGPSETREFERILVATGPAHRDILASQTFLSELEQAGELTLDATGLGLSTAWTGRAIGANGAANPTLFVAGPLARGTFGELMGLPQVSEYAQAVAARVVATLLDIQPSHRAPAA